MACSVTPLDCYLDILLFWNRRINLTATRDVAEIKAKHIGDGVAAAARIPADARTLIDVGSGAGFPGAVIALERPELSVVLVESNRKKAAFLEALRREVPIPNIAVRPQRIEAVGPTPPFDVATSRATFALPEWLALGATLVRPGGLVIGFEGPTRIELPPGAERAPYAAPGEDARA